MRTRVSFKYFVNDWLWKHLFPSNSPQTPYNFISLTMLVTLRPFTQFLPENRATILQKSAKIYLTW